MEGRVSSTAGSRVWASWAWMGWAGHIIGLQGMKETILGLQEVGIDYYIIYRIEAYFVLF
jgi:hypothetical protein